MTHDQARQSLLKICYRCSREITRGEWPEMLLETVWLPGRCDNPLNREIEWRRCQCGALLSLEVPVGTHTHDELVELVERRRIETAWDGVLPSMPRSWAIRDTTPLAECGLTLEVW